MVSSLSREIPSGSSLQVFTDGSSPKGQEISGASVVVYNHWGEKIAERGFPILSYGNNYLAELAAITVAVLAVPQENAAILYSDSLAAISAASGPPMSERELTRTPCRGWLTTLRSTLLSKPYISLRYVRAHTLGTDQLSKGNDMADRVAKRSRVDSEPPPLVTLASGGVFLDFRGQTLLKGIKEDIRAILCECRVRTWKKLSRQGRTLKQFRTTFQRFQKRVRAYAVSSGKERVWSYFILASLRWLTPTPKGSSTPPMCYLCDSLATNSMDHFLGCAGLKVGHCKL
jgi:ribonuclease HI